MECRGWTIDLIVLTSWRYLPFNIIETPLLFCYLYRQRPGMGDRFNSAWHPHRPGSHRLHARCRPVPGSPSKEQRWRHSQWTGWLRPSTRCKWGDYFLANLYFGLVMTISFFRKAWDFYQRLWFGTIINKFPWTYKRFVIIKLALDYNRCTCSFMVLFALRIEYCLTFYCHFHVAGTIRS